MTLSFQDWCSNFNSGEHKISKTVKDGEPVLSFPTWAAAGEAVAKFLAEKRFALSSSGNRDDLHVRHFRCPVTTNRARWPQYSPCKARITFRVESDGVTKFQNEILEHTHPMPLRNQQETFQDGVQDKLGSLGDDVESLKTAVNALHNDVVDVKATLLRLEELLSRTVRQQSSSVTALVQTSSPGQPKSDEEVVVPCETLPVPSQRHGERKHDSHDDVGQAALPINFVLIPKNEFLVLPHKTDQRDIVHCTCYDVCDEHCMNRICGLECFEQQNCRVGPSCGNRALQTLKEPNMEVFETLDRGMGLRVLDCVSRNDFVLEYVGEVINRKMMSDRINKWTQEHPDDNSRYMVEINDKFIIDARRRGNLSRFVNHSCQPNCDLVKVVVGTTTRLALKAKYDIAPLEELTFDYKVASRGAAWFDCRCGSPNCRFQSPPRKNPGRRPIDHAEDDVTVKRAKPDNSDEVTTKRAKPYDSDVELDVTDIVDKVEIGKTVQTQVTHAEGNIDVILASFGLETGISATNGHCLFVAWDCCEQNNRHPVLDDNGNLADEAASERIVRTMKKLGRSVVKFDDNLWYDNHPYVARRLASGSCLLLDAVKDLFRERIKFPPRKTLPIELWGHSCDVFGYRRLTSKNIFVFAQVQDANAWFLSRYCVRPDKKSSELKVAKDTLTVADWNFYLNPLPAEAIFLVNKRNTHWEPIFRMG